MSIHNEIEPLLRSSTEENRNYNKNALAEDLDEEYIVGRSSGSNSNETTVDEHYAEYLVKNRLGEATLTIITLCLCMSEFLSAIDTSIVITILNVIGTEFKSSNLSVLIMISYMLSVLPSNHCVDGKLSDIFGRKSTLVAILCLFLIGSWLCGAAHSMLAMSITSSIAGLGGGGLMTMASVVIHNLVPMRDRGKYQSYVNTAQTIGTIVGAPLGGIINDYIGWRYCFYLNLPPCLLIFYIYIYKLENYNLAKGAKQMDNIKEKLEKIDFIGAAFLLSGNLTFVVGVSLGGNTREWSDPFIIALLTSAVFFFTLFGNRNVVAVCLNNFFLCSSTMTFIYLVPQYFTGVLGYNASSAGLWVLPRIVMVTFGFWVAGHYLRATGRYKNFLVSIHVLHISTALSTYSWTDSTPIWLRLLCMNVEGFCFGVVFVATMVALVADITHADTASATSMIFLCRSTDWLSSSTITTAILQSNFKKNSNKTITGPEATEVIEFFRTSITKVRTLAPEIQVVVILSLGQTIHYAFAYGVVCSVLCFLAALFMRNCHLGDAHSARR